MNLDRARMVADAVLFEGYLLYPYRATSSKNQSRWQWGVLGPPGAAAAGVGEQSSILTQCLLRRGAAGGGQVSVLLRFLQLQTRTVERLAEGVAAAENAELTTFDPVDADRASVRFEPVAELRVGGQSWLSWDEAVSHEIELGPYPIDKLVTPQPVDVRVDGGQEVEYLTNDDGRVVGRLVRRRRPLLARLRVGVEATGVEALLRVAVEVDNVDEPVLEPAERQRAARKDDAIGRSLIGTHLLLSAADAEFVSLLEPPADAAAAAQACEQRRCWPVLAGEPGATDVVLASPIILYDYPEVAEQSAGALFDSTEIDEILTLRVMTLTDEEKAAARATDPRAAEIIDRCDQMSPTDMQALHGILRDPHGEIAGIADPVDLPASPFADVRDVPDMDEVPTFAEPTTYPGPDDIPNADPATYPGPDDIRNADPPTFDTGGTPWWDPAVDGAVSPDVDTVMVRGVKVGKDSLVRLHPSRRADAQDIFFTGQTARVTAVLSDVDGEVHVAVVLADDPAADVHEWYGRYLYFAPEELEPLGHTPIQTTSDYREESRS